MKNVNPLHTLQEANIYLGHRFKKPVIATTKTLRKKLGYYLEPKIFGNQAAWALYDVQKLSGQSREMWKKVIWPRYWKLQDMVSSLERKLKSPLGKLEPFHKKAYEKKLAQATADLEAFKAKYGGDKAFKQYNEFLSNIREGEYRATGEFRKMKDIELGLENPVDFNSSFIFNGRQKPDPNTNPALKAMKSATLRKGPYLPQ